MQTAQNEVISLRIQIQSKDDINRRLLDELEEFQIHNRCLRKKLDERKFAPVVWVGLGLISGTISTLILLGMAAHIHLAQHLPRF